MENEGGWTHSELLTGRAFPIQLRFLVFIIRRNKTVKHALRFLIMLTGIVFPLLGCESKTEFSLERASKTTDTQRITDSHEEIGNEKLITLKHIVIAYLQEIRLP